MFGIIIFSGRRVILEKIPGKVKNNSCLFLYFLFGKLIKHLPMDKVITRNVCYKILSFDMAKIFTLLYWFHVISTGIVRHRIVRKQGGTTLIP